MEENTVCCNGATGVEEGGNPEFPCLSRRFQKQCPVPLWLCFQYTARRLASILEHFNFRPFPTFMPACLPDAIDCVFKEIIMILNFFFFFLPRAFLKCFKIFLTAPLETPI